MTNLLDSNNDVSDWLSSLPEVPGVRPLEQLPQAALGTGRRAAYRPKRAPTETSPMPPSQQIISLVREGTVLRWRSGGSGLNTVQQRAAGRAALPVGKVMKQYAFEQLDTSQVTQALVKLDKLLTPEANYPGISLKTGFRRWQNGRLEPLFDTSLLAGKKVLMFIHGTFSCSEAMLDQGLAKEPEGAKLLKDAESHYDFVIVFDHPTLSISPILNAFDLAALLRPSPIQLDIVCHSRGGLVSRWFCEAFSDQNMIRRVIFVASPLAGTSLAAAPRLRGTLDLLTNIANVLRVGSDLAAANPLFLAASGLLAIFSSITGFMSQMPVLDAAIALVPGLDAQSRTGNNEELRRLRANTGNSPFNAGAIQYFAIAANFEPKDFGWNFLQFFSKPMQRVADWGSDIIFQDKNDLVVDTLSMSEVADGQTITMLHDFGTTDRVHHVNYFRQVETAHAIRKGFCIP